MYLYFKLYEHVATKNFFFALLVHCLLPKPLTNDRWRETGERTCWLCDLVAIFYCTNLEYRFYIVFFFPAQFL
jgi:hypothetical protein